MTHSRRNLHQVELYGHDNATEWHVAYHTTLVVSNFREHNNATLFPTITKINDRYICFVSKHFKTRNNLITHAPKL